MHKCNDKREAQRKPQNTKSIESSPPRYSLTSYVRGSYWSKIVTRPSAGICCSICMLYTLTHTNAHIYIYIYIYIYIRINLICTGRHRFTARSAIHAPVDFERSKRALSFGSLQEAS